MGINRAQGGQGTFLEITPGQGQGQKHHNQYPDEEQEEVFYAEPLAGLLQGL
ncbi:hypothetical protein ES703_94987 [subsurface metagenome]